jgi:hypothetical protein
VLRVKARGHRDLATIVGHAATISAWEWITASGDWVNDRTHGQQLKARFMRTSAPSSVGGIDSTRSYRLCRDDPQEPRVRISRGHHPSHDPALHLAAAQSALYRRNPWKAIGCAGRTEEGDCHCCTQCVGETALVEVEGMAALH